MPHPRRGYWLLTLLEAAERRDAFAHRACAGAPSAPTGERACYRRHLRRVHTPCDVAADTPMLWGGCGLRRQPARARAGEGTAVTASLSPVGVRGVGPNERGGGSVGQVRATPVSARHTVPWPGRRARLLPATPPLRRAAQIREARGSGRVLY